MEYAKFDVAAISDLGEEVRIFDLKPQKGGMPAYKPGNFFLLRMIGGDGKPIFRSYSAASHPSESWLKVCIKKKGAFTGLLWNLRKGDEIEVCGPFGLFALEKDDRERVFIGGGVGIAPIRSMVIETIAEGKACVIFQSSKTLAGLVFKSEIESFEAKGGNLRYYFALTQECVDHGRCILGRLSSAVIKEKLGSPEGKTFYICGSKDMASSISEGLKKDGVPAEKIRVEAWG